MILYKNWDLMRLLRLGIGLWLGYSAIAESQPLFGLMAGMFLIQAFFNLGCGGGSCNMPSKKENVASKTDEVIFEEIK